MSSPVLSAIISGEELFSCSASRGLYFILRFPKTDEIFRILICRIEPELVELIRWCPFCIEHTFPPSVLLNLVPSAFLINGVVRAKASPLSFLRISSVPCHDISPLIGTAHLQTYAHVFPQIVEIIALNKLIRKFCKRHTAVKSFLYRIFRHHVIDGDVFSDITDKFKETEIFKPVVIVDYFSGLFSTIEIQKFFQLCFLTSQVVSKYFFVE